MTFFRDQVNQINRRCTHTTNSLLPSYDEEDENESNNQLANSMLSRTPLLIMDYIQFLASRTIQKNWRGYHVRRSAEKNHWAAIVIQRWWRGFYVRRNYMRFVEEKLQNVLIQHYNKAATKIQALFRGWWQRHTVHDMTGLKKMQLTAAEDLLTCVAFKLHYLLRTYSIPGVYSLRNSHCLSRVEKLMISMNYRFHNARAHAAIINRKAILERQRANFKNAKHYTEVPFSGPNYKGNCKPHCEDILGTTKDMDRRMYKIIETYEKSQREATSKMARSKLSERKRHTHSRKILEQKDKSKRDFCGDVIASMRRWSIWDGTKMEKDIFRNPENLENFLDEAFDIMMDLGNCHCKMPVHDVVYCH
ncbi:uncharacterized protein LOC115766594 [Drosophila novamexicana]|uniref:uncharacterized protein LOC115766594 n=1 Tax=Drosophila novamexicana TaxID=47314 RepID=UPI0011E5F30D|nr:uncharacterized protein LOC115766594 [Drosophila novamexicana]